jgi:hypothetical protein
MCRSFCLRTLLGSVLSLSLLLCVPAILNAKAPKAVPPPTPAEPLVSEPSVPALAAKAPGAPGYGLQVTTGTGKVMITNLSFQLTTHKPQARFYRIVGPAGLGPYRIGLVLGFHKEENMPANHLHYSWYSNYFTLGKAEDGFPAKKAGLVPDKYARLVIESVDGSNFGWDVNALVWHITNSPMVEINTAKLPVLFGGPSRSTYKIHTRKLETPVDPADGGFENIPPIDEIKAWLGNKQTWQDLLILRSRTAQFAPLALDLAGRKVWVVRAQGELSQETPPRAPRVLEFWKEDPLTGPFDTGIMDVWPEPQDGFRAGLALRIGDRWYRLQAYAQDPATGRLTTFELRPWEADVPSLLSGADLAGELGSLKAPGVQESLEQLANDALVEWKTRTLPGMLRTQESPALEDLVIRIEKGLLALDLQVRGIRQRLDAQARAQAAQQAQVDKPGGNQAAPAPAPVAPTTDSERLADLLDQRKAILQAVLGTSKQSLAQVRR